MADWERARQPEQKEQRREAILAAARGLFEKRPYVDISFNEIAREAGFSKPNLYRYFSTREEIFLVIFQAEQESFVDAFIARLKRIRSENVLDAICRGWVDVALKHQAWLHLLPQFASSLEANSSVRQIVKFKKVAYAKFGEAIQMLHEIYPALSLEQWQYAMMCVYSLMAGYVPFANPSDNVIEALKHLDVNQSVKDLRTVILGAMKALIVGLEVVARNDATEKQ